MITLKPRCIYEDKNGVVQGIAYCSDGFLLPCCWLDGLQSKKELTELGLYNSELKLENNESIEQVIRSTQWKNFIRIITEDNQSAPNKCHEKCKI